MNIEELNQMLEQTEAVSSEISSKLAQNLKTNTRLIHISHKWKETNRVMLDQISKIDLAVDSSLGLDNTIRQKIAKLRTRVTLDTVQTYIDQVAECVKLKDSPVFSDKQTASIKHSNNEEAVRRAERVEELREELEQALHFSGLQLRAMFRTELKELREAEDGGAAAGKLRIYDWAFKKIGTSLHYGDFLKRAIEEVEAGVDESEASLVPGLQALGRRLAHAGRIFDEKGSREVMVRDLIKSTAKIVEGNSNHHQKFSISYFQEKSIF